MLRQIYADENYIYAATSSGLAIVDVNTELLYNFVHYSDGFTTVWGNDSKVFLGTPASGVKLISKGDLGTLIDYAQVPKLSSNDVRYIHGYGDIFACCTASGIHMLGVYERESYYSTANAWKCFVVPSTAVYYTISGSYWSVARKNETRFDWTSSDILYEADGFGILASGIRINDIFVTENTSISGINNTLFIATSNGVYVMDEDSLETRYYSKK
jgi:hypothetical protein